MHISLNNCLFFMIKSFSNPPPPGQKITSTFVLLPMKTQENELVHWSIVSKYNMQSCKWISDDVFSRSTENIVGFQLQTYIYFQREIRLHIDNRKTDRSV